MNVNDILKELEALGTEQTKKTYLRHGAREPLFGVTTGSLKPLVKKFKKNYQLSMELYRTGNYDAMYLAGLIADPSHMSEEDLQEWMAGAYCDGISDFVVSRALVKSLFMPQLADQWMNAPQELYASTAWTSYALFLGQEADDHIDYEKMKNYLHRVEKEIHSERNRVRYAMNNFVIALAISYSPLHQEAVAVSKRIGEVKVDFGETACRVPDAGQYIQKAIDKNMLGRKRRV